MKKEMLINVLQPEECRIAIVEDGVLEELYVERTSLENYTGNIYKGRIVNIEPAIQAAFVDFSVGRNGFLHVSDIEPHYYRTLVAEVEAAPQDRDRDRGPRGGSRSEDRTGRDRALDLEPLYDDDPRHRERERDWDREDDRPDRSEKGRRDRSERRFGEGLTDDWQDEPPPRPAPPPPPPPPRPESAGWAYRRAEPPRPAPPLPPPPPPEPPRSRPPREVDPIEAELPPSRTQRGRIPSPEPPRPREPDRQEPPLGREDVEPTARERPGARGRGRPRGPAARITPPPSPGPGREAEPELEPVPEPDAGLLADEPETLDELPRRRGGRAAIRARGGDRGTERREDAPQHPRGLAAERPYTPPPAEPIRSREPDRPRPPAPAPEPQRERTRAPSRAGQPGYVPRRERSRETEPPVYQPEAPTAPLLWPEEAEAETQLDTSLRETDQTTELIEESGPDEEPRRRRRRRRRRGERAERERDQDQDRERDWSRGPPPTREEIEAEATTDFELDAGVETGGELEGLVDVEVPEELEEIEEAEEIEEVEGPVVEAREDDRIDPELEEEIRREIEEIAELERELGLRGGVEPRVRRPDEREAAARGYRGRGTVKPPIQEIFRRGDEVLVQVIKESIGTKGPTLSTYISIPGRYLVLMPGLNRVGVSRKIADEAQRRKLREIMNELNPPKGLGFIVRTAGLDRSKRELARDLAYLLRLWKVILRRIKKARAPAPIYQESDMITRTIRDVFTTDIDTIWIDEPAAFERAQEFLKIVMPKYVDRLRFYDERVPLFYKYGIEEEIAKIQRRRVDLPEGGSIVIDQTEALVAIDVNSGNFRVEDDAERTAYEMNLRAAKEIARQLRLRDLGGVIVNDFIDMRDERHRRGVERALREAVKRDRARTKILRMSQFGLIEMTRQRIRPSLKRSIYEDCTHCRGAGVVKTVESMSIDVMRLLALAAHKPEIRRINVCVSPTVATYLNNRKRPEIGRLEAEGNLTIYIHHEEGVPAEHLQLDCYDAHGAEVRILPPPQAAHPRRVR